MVNRNVLAGLVGLLFLSCLAAGCRSSSNANTPAAGSRTVVNQMVTAQQKEQQAIENNPNIPPDIKAKMFAYSDRGQQPSNPTTH